MSESNAESSPELAQLAQQLEASGRYQVLKKFEPVRQYLADTPPAACHLVCIIDTETTGLNTDSCEIIELGYQLVEFDSNGYFYKVVCAKNFLNEPEAEISAEVTQVTGLTLEDVKGHQIPWEEVAADMAQVQLCIAHNAGFDRPILERYHACFVEKVWGCSASQIDWFHLAKVGSRSQEFLCWKVGHFYYEAHRALDDVQALTQLLSQPISDNAQPALSFLLKTVRQQKVMIKATGAPFDLKDDLKQRGYRWQPQQRVWQKVFDAAEQEAELAWLLDHQVHSPDIRKLKATDSFSIRAK